MLTIPRTHEEGNLGFAKIESTNKAVQKLETPSRQGGSQAASKSSIPNHLVCGPESGGPGESQGVSGPGTSVFSN